MAELIVSDLMTTDIVALLKEQSLPFAEELMRLERIRHLPVVDDDGHLVGLVTHRDLLGAQVSALTALDDEDKTDLELAVPVAKVMRTDVWTVAPDSPALEAAQIMLDHAFGCLPVVDQRVLVGIVTEADYLALLVRVLKRGRKEITAEWLAP